VKIKKCCFLIFNFYFLIVYSIPLFAQVDTANVDSVKLKYIYSQELGEYYLIDSSLSRFHNYNPAVNNLGNLGTAHQNIIFTPSNLVGFDIGFHQFDKYLFKHNETKYYDAKRPFTEVFYVQGQKEEQLLQVEHAQNIRANIHAGLKYRRLVSDGFYQRQRTNDHNFSIYNWYHTKNNRYNLFINVIVNTLRAQENGGIENDTFIASSSYTDRQTVPVILMNAENKWRQNSFYLQQSWDMGKTTEIQINDSTTKKYFEPRWRIQYAFNYQSGYYWYKDEVTDTSMQLDSSFLRLNTSFYPAIFLDSLKTLDSLHYRKFSNQIVLKKLESKGHQFDLLLKYNFYHLQHGFYSADSILYGLARYVFGRDFYFNDLIAGAEWQYSPVQKKIFASLKGKYSFLIGYLGSFSDYNQDDYWTEGIVGYRFGSWTKLQLQINAQRKVPAYIQNHYVSNHFQWWRSDGLEKTDIYSVDIHFSQSRWKFNISGKTYLINNYIYWDTNAWPRQLETPLQVFVGNLQKDFKLGPFHLDNYLIYQFVSNDTFLRLPALITRHSFYFQKDLFKKALLAKMGFDIRYQTNYFANSYMPVTGQFYLQNEQKLKYYPIVDLFFNMKVKKARIFFLMENITQGLLVEDGYFKAPHYPANGRSFKFGILWMFFD